MKVHFHSLFCFVDFLDKVVGIWHGAKLRAELVFRIVTVDSCSFVAVASDGTRNIADSR